jgi:hypothetical protein
MILNLRKNSINNKYFQVILSLLCGNFLTAFFLPAEAFYRHQISGNISVTIGAIWITVPNQDANNSDIFVGVFRSMFSF